MNKALILLLQSRPENDVSDNEYESICRLGGIAPERVVRLRMDRDELGEVNLDEYAAVIMGGGPANFAYLDEKKSPEQLRFEPWLKRLIKRIVAEDRPFFGMCLGVGAIALAYDTKPSFDYGEAVELTEVRLTDEGVKDPLLADMPDIFMAFAGHKEGIGEVPNGCVELARSKTCVQMLRSGQNVYATQFHPEIDLPGLALRIEAYKHHGYFQPEEADEILANATTMDFSHAVDVLRNFVKRYLTEN